MIKIYCMKITSIGKRKGQTQHEVWFSGARKQAGRKRKWTAAQKQQRKAQGKGGHVCWLWVAGSEARWVWTVSWPAELHADTAQVVWCLRQS